MGSPSPVDDASQSILTTYANICDGMLTKLWYDRWLLEMPFAIVVSNLLKCFTKRNISGIDALEDDSWMKFMKNYLPRASLHEFTNVIKRLLCSLLPRTNDTLTW